MLSMMAIKTRYRRGDCIPVPYVNIWDIQLLKNPPKCKSVKEETLEIVQMGRLTAEMNAIDEGNLTEISTCRSDACSECKHVRYIVVLLGAQTPCKDLQGRVTLTWHARTLKETDDTPLELRRWDGASSLAAWVGASQHQRPLSMEHIL